MRKRIKRAAQRSAARKKRATVPLDLVVELLLVIDDTVFAAQTKYANTSNANLTLLYMRNYFAHYLNGVNNLYQNIFQDDADVRITVKLKNLIFIQVTVF
jgi:hypothetical protein